MAVLEIKVKTSYLILMTIAVSNRYEYDMNMTVLDSRAEHRVKLMEAAIEWRTIILIAISISLFVLLRLEKVYHSYQVTHTVTSTAQYNTHRCSTRIKTNKTVRSAASKAVDANTKKHST